MKNINKILKQSKCPICKRESVLCCSLGCLLSTNFTEEHTKKKFPKDKLLEFANKLSKGEIILNNNKFNLINIDEFVEAIREHLRDVSNK